MNNHKNMLILGGYSKYNINLVKNMKEIYSKDYNVTSMEYDHWHSDSEMNYEKELNKLKEVVENKNIDVVVAKSIGTYLSTKAIKRGILHPKQIIFLGYPLKFLQERNLSYMDDLLSVKEDYNTTFIQQEFDPMCSASKLKEILDGRIPVITVPGNDHSYGDVEGIKVHVDEFIKENNSKVYHL